MTRLVLLLLGALRALIRSRSDLVLENLALRQQVAALAAKGGRPRITGVDRWFWTMRRRCWSRWTEVLGFVKPETVVRWHRAGFRRYWASLSRRGPARPASDPRKPPRAHSPDGDGECRMGSAEDPRRAPRARLRAV